MTLKARRKSVRINLLKLLLDVPGMGRDKLKADGFQQLKLREECLAHQLPQYGTCDELDASWDHYDSVPHTK